MMKRLLLLAALLVAPLAAAAAQDLHVYAGAGLREAVDALAARFETQTGAKVVVEYGGSGQLLARISETGKGDVFIPGSMMYIDKLDKAGAVSASRGLAVHGAVLAVNRAAAAKITSLDDLAKPGVRLGLGDAQAMALGRTAEEILSHLALKDAILANVVTRAATVKQLTLYVANGDVDAAIIGGPDAAGNADKVVSIAIPSDLYQPEIAGFALLKSAVDPALAAQFGDLLLSEAGRQAFAKAGFPPLAP